MDMARMRCEVLPVEGALNVRDLGGYPVGDGRVLRKRRFIRAGSLWEITEAGRQTVAGLGVDCVVDLRSQNEVRRMPDCFEGDERVAYHNISMLDNIQSNVGGQPGRHLLPRSLAEMYIGLLDADQDKFRRIFEIFADPAYKGILFHCTAGKDRTGVTAMLLLALAGVEEAVIVEDYSWSEHLIGPVSITGEAVPRFLFESHPDTMRAALGHLREVYGSPRKYLEKIGIREKQMDAVREKLLEPA